MTIPTEYYLYLSIIMVIIGLYGIFSRRSMIRILLGIEFIINAANLNFVVFSMTSNPYDQAGQVIVLLVLASAAAEMVIGLTLLILLYRKVGAIDITLAVHARGVENGK